MVTSDSLIIGFNRQVDGTVSTVLIVGRKTPGEVPDIINAFQGAEAEELYRKLTEKKTPNFRGE